MAAQERYGKRAFLLRGQIVRFSHGVVTRDYEILLDSGGAAITVVCRFGYPEQFRSVFTTDRGARLVATMDKGGRTELAALGQTLTIKGRCRGLKGTDVLLSGCEVVK